MEYQNSSTHAKRRHFFYRSSSLALLLFAYLWVSGCGLRTIPPIRYLPIFGKEKEITTTLVLTRALKDRNLAVRAQAVKLLGILSQSNENKIKKQAARALGIAAKDSDPGIRLQAIENLGKMEEKYGNKYLHAALKDSNPFVRERVMQVLNDRQTQIPDPS
ncbi:MAG: HEAT repeat protein [Candidatus Latescibacterota bacterium]|jgi:HEAT repeat protein